MTGMALSLLVFMSIYSAQVTSGLIESRCIDSCCQDVKATFVHLFGLLVS